MVLVQGNETQKRQQKVGYGNETAIPGSFASSSSPTLILVSIARHFVRLYSSRHQHMRYVLPRSPIPNYVPSTDSTVSFTMTRFIIVIIALHDHVVDIVFVAKPPFIILSYMSLLIHCISRYTAGGIHIESYFVLSFEL